MKTFYLFLLTALAFLAVSCSNSAPAKMKRLADKVEAKGDNYSLKDWKKAAEKMETYSLQFIEDIDSYKLSEKAEAVKAFTKFSAKAVLCGAGSVLEDVDWDDVYEQLEESSSNLIKGAKGLLEGLGL